jgi:hypothetical protein
VLCCQQVTETSFHQEVESFKLLNHKHATDVILYFFASDGTGAEEDGMRTESEFSLYLICLYCVY